MVGVETLQVFVLAAGALILAPGPDTVFVLSRAAGTGRTAGVRAAAGISTGVLVHTLGAVVGVSVLLRTSAVAFAVLKYAGATYLAVLGVRALLGYGDGFDAAGEAAREATGSYRRGVAVNVLNPKVALFFLAFLPQFVGADAPPGDLLLLGACYAALTMAYLGAVAVATARAATLARPRVSRALQGVSGAVLLGFGAGLALE